MELSAMDTPKHHARASDQTAVRLKNKMATGGLKDAEIKELFHLLMENMLAVSSSRQAPES